MSECQICGARLAGSKEGFANHIKRYHGGVMTKTNEAVLKANNGDGSTGRNGSAKIVPAKLTTRSVARIVEETEWGMGKAIFPDTRPVKF